jgi:alanine racemase
MLNFPLTFSRPGETSPTPPSPPTRRIASPLRCPTAPPTFSGPVLPMGSAPSVVTIDLGTLERNASLLRNFVPRPTKFCAVMKNNAFGHGIGPVSRAIAPHVDMLGIVDNWEVQEIRNAGVTLPILRVRCASPDEVAEAGPGVEEMIASLEAAQAFSAIGAASGRMINVHIFVNIGENRMSFNLPYDMEDLLASVKLPNLNVVGIMGHFACAGDLGVTASQLEYFMSVSVAVESAVSTAKGAPLRLIRHVANTQAAISMPESHLDMVRIGGGLFGQESNVIPLGLKPAFTWSTRVSLVRRVPAGTAVGYGMAYSVEKDKVIATLPVGYGNGLRKTLSSSRDAWATHGEVTVKGVRCPIVGRISSAVATIDVTNVEQITGYPVRMGDRVILMGTTCNTDTAEDMAHRLGTSFDEITASIIGASTEYIAGPSAGVDSHAL